MVEKLRLNHHSDMPIYRQIVTQLSFMIETGSLEPGQKLPSAKLLANNLHINRNTVARAYAELSDLGLVAGRGRAGTHVVGAGASGDGASTSIRERARGVLGAATRECVGLGLSAEEISSMVMSIALRAEADLLSVCFVECNADRADYFAAELEERLGLKVTPLVLGEFVSDEIRADLLVTTFFHLAEVRGIMRDHPETEILAIVVGPHVQTLVQIASVARDRVVGIWYRTDDQAISVRDSLTQAGIRNIVVLQGTGAAELAGVDCVVIPSAMPELKARLEHRVQVIEFGNVLDAASIRMVADVVDDLQAAKRAS